MRLKRKGVICLKARVMMIIDGTAYEYGTYMFNTDADKKRVNEVALQVAEERGCQTYIEEAGGISG